MIRRLTLWLACTLYEAGVRLLNWSWRHDERRGRPAQRSPAVRPTPEMMMETPTVPWVPRKAREDWKRWN